MFVVTEIKLIFTLHLDSLIVTLPEGVLNVIYGHLMPLLYHDLPNFPPNFLYTNPINLSSQSPVSHSKQAQ